MLLSYEALFNYYTASSKNHLQKKNSIIKYHSISDSLPTLLWKFQTSELASILLFEKLLKLKFINSCAVCVNCIAELFKFIINQLFYLTMLRIYSEYPVNFTNKKSQYRREYSPIQINCLHIKYLKRDFNKNLYASQNPSNHVRFHFIFYCFIHENENLNLVSHVFMTFNLL